MKRIDFRTSSYFSDAFIFAGALLCPFGLLAGYQFHWMIGIVLVSTGLVIVTTHYRLRIDLERKSYFDYTWILGYAYGESGTYEKIDHIFINRKKVSQKLNSRASSTIIHSQVFDGYLKFSDDVKIHLMTKRDKEDLIKKLKPISAQLKIDLFDNSAS